MSISRRTAIAVRSIGVASAAAAIALGVAGNAFACSITEFTPTASCTAGQGAINVLDKDGSGTHVNITVHQGDNVVGSKDDVVGTQEGVNVSIPVAWTPNTTYTVTVVKTSGAKVGDKDVTTGSEACATPPTTPPPTSPPVTTPTTPATEAPTTTPAAPATTPPTAAPTSSAAAPVVDDTNAPSPAAGGSSDLAETGGGSNTGMIAGIAGALVVIGGGAVFGLRRRGAAARH
ncbi:LAETG motif-containing sortase-dependent surface protein [Streptomyces sp. CA-111067]|uniref:LAETG motif-containing sortase-dependent surface protein n=1 Tax=Streptomyces sp. CA-111067 TaxID=3240046 RepID=UPI003D9847F2